MAAAGNDKLDLTGAYGPIRRRHVTCVFADICNFTALGIDTHEYDIWPIKGALVDATQRVCEKYGGLLIRSAGDGVFIVFGYLNPQENDVLLAGDAALDLHEAFKAIEYDKRLFPSWFTPQLHTGIHAGVAEIREGRSFDGYRDLVGNSANIASKLCEAAGADEIYASRTTFGEVQSFFDTDDLGRLELTDRKIHLRAIRIRGKAEAGRRFEARRHRGLTDFVGRQRELRTLHDILETEVLRNRQLKVVTIVGDRGVGKTRVAEEFWAELEGLGIGTHRGYCENYRSGYPSGAPTAAPLQPFLQILTDFFQIDHAMSSAHSAREIGERLEAIAPNLIGHEKSIERMLSLTPSLGARDAMAELVAVNVLTEFFSSLASLAPRALFIDDWQWADDASRQLLGNLIRHCRRLPMLVVTTSRELDPSDPALTNAELLRLGPFNAPETEQAVRSLLPNWVGKGFIQKVYSQSGGIPLFIEEICRSPLDQVTLATTDRIDEEEAIPAWLRGLIEKRVEALPAAQAQIVRIASVVGHAAPLWLLEELLGGALDDNDLYALVDKDLIHLSKAQGLLRFKHGITRDVIYDFVGRERIALHQRIADALVSSSGPGGIEELYEALAYHYAGALDDEQTAYFAELAGDKAMARSSMDRAREQYGAALASLSKMEVTNNVKRRQLRICQSWALPSVYNPDASQLPTLLSALEFAQELDSHTDEAQMRYWLGYMNYALGNFDEAVDWCRQAIELARRVDHGRLAAQALAVKGQTHAAACEYPEALPDLDEAIALKRRNPSKKHLPVGSSYATAAKALVLADLGRFDDAHAYIEQALEPFEGRTHEIASSIQNIRCAILLWQGRWQRALDASRQSQAIAEQVSLQYDFAMGRAMEAYAKCNLSGAEVGVEDLLTTIEYLRSHKIQLFLSLPTGWLTDALVALGDLERGREYGQITLAMAKRKDRLGAAMACRALARAAARQSELAEKAPDHYFGLAMASARARDSRHEQAVTRLQHAEFLISQDEHSAAAGLLDEAIRDFEQMDMQWHLERAIALQESRG